MAIIKVINMSPDQNPYQSFCNCAFNGQNGGGKGTTIWYGGDLTLAGYQEQSLSFTDTLPDCRDGSTQLCIVTYELATTDYSGNSIVIWRYLNDVSVGSTTHSLVPSHNVTEAFDVEPLNNHQVYVHGGLNTFKFLNASSTSVQIKNFRIFRAYGMRDLSIDGQGACVTDGNSAANGSIDYSRQDYPCNYASNGDRISFVHWGANFEAVPISPGDSIQWTFKNPNDNANNYVDRCACFFNFNNVSRSWPDTADDTKYTIKLNGSEIANYYHGGYGIFGLGYSSQFPTVDLAQYGSLYHDEPGQINTIELVNAGAGIATLSINNDPALGGVDIFRFYKVKNICQDDFQNIDQNSNDKVDLFETVSCGGSVSLTGGQLQVAVPSNGTWCQAGKVTRYSYDSSAFYPGSDKQGFETAIDVVSVNNLYEMNFLISSDNKRTDIDPSGLNNWYRIMKDRTDSTVKVQRRLNGGSISSIWRYWNASTGQLKIKVSGGSIAFYENGILRHAEPFMLPSNKCNLYAYTSSNTTGTGAFDNFYIKPPEGAFKDDFVDGNYDGWTVDSGSWSVSNGKLQSGQQGSHIHYNQAFASPNRYVAADVQTLSSSGTAYVPFLMVNEVNGSNMIYADIRTDGKVELVLFYGGTPTNWQATSSLNAYNSNRIAVSISGTNAKVYVNNTLYLDVTNNNFANISNGYVGLWTYQSTGTMDNVLVFTQ
jgi:hypothetical protein